MRQRIDYMFLNRKGMMHVTLRHLMKILRVTYLLPGGPYEAFGGRDASRALARFAVDAATDKYDDLSDLNTTEMNSIKEWEEQFKGEQISVFRIR